MSTLPTRSEFLFFSDNGKHLFYVLTYIALAIMAYQFVGRARFWMKGRPTPLQHRQGIWNFIPTYGAVKRYIPNVWTFIIAQKKVRSSRKKSGAPMHLLIFYGFLAFFLATTILAINTYGPVKFYFGGFYEVYELTIDVMTLVFIVGIGWALIRRIIENHRAGRRTISHAASDYWTLALLFVIATTGIWLEASRISAHPMPFDWVSPVGLFFAHLQGRIQPETYRFIWWFHMIWVWIFFMALPQMKLKHIVMAIATSAGNPTTPTGRLTPITMEEVELTGKIGAEMATDLDRWHLMSLDACMECGRCTEVCPAWGVGKVLNPKQVVQGIRSALTEGTSIVEKVSEEALWACTTCNACVEACPVLIRHVDLIVDSRRSLVAEGKLSGSAASMLRQTASTGNAWGTPSGSREDWMKDQSVPLCRDETDFEVLLWVGCAGSTDPGAIKTTRALANLLSQAGVKYACLGNEETCTGDPARRVGDEFTFQEKAQSNIENFKKYGVKKVVTPCPHCFNTLKNEYGDFGAELEVEHHTQMLSRLVDDGKLKPIDSESPIAFHDPCYLGRINEVVDAPRNVIGTNLLEPEHHGKKTLCCGAGGGRMWMDESPSQRPANRRMKELLDTGASTIGLGCPFCKIMLETGIPAEKQDQVKLLDLAELLQEANLS